MANLHCDVHVSGPGHGQADALQSTKVQCCNVNIQCKKVQSVQCNCWCIHLTVLVTIQMQCRNVELSLSPKL